MSADGQETLGGALWTKDIRVTRNSADDWLPQIVVDASEVAHVIWQRSGLWTKTFDNKGTFLSKEVFITPHVVTGYGSPAQYPLGPQVAIDTKANIHVVWDDGWHNCYYQKLDPNADAISSVIQLGNQDNAGSHGPSIAVDPVNDHIHIVHEDYQYQCEDILYDKLDQSGRVLVNEVSLSSDVSSHCEHSTLATDEQGNVHVVFGSATGCWWRKVDQNGVVQGNSVILPGLSAYQIADMACTPNGDVHLVWTGDGVVRYTRMDNNGTMLDVNVTVSKNGVDPGPPRIAAARGENTVHIVWHDMRDGNSEIYYAVMGEGDYDQTPENIRLTHDSARSLFPRVAVSPEDSVHVVWSDSRDGNSEVYYKFMCNFKMEMGPVHLSELAAMYFVRPAETKTMDVYLRNLGALPDDYNVTLTIDDWAEAKGWSFTLNETQFLGVPEDTTVFFNVTMTAPRYARPGDYVNVTLEGTSASGETERLGWRAFIIIEKRVTVVCEAPTRVIEPGSCVMFDLHVANVGDVDDSYVVEHVLIPEDAGWEVVVDAHILELAVDESTNLTVRLTAPEDAKANDNGTVYLRVRSMTDASVWDGKKLMGIVDPQVYLEIEAPVPTAWVDPGGMVVVPIIIRNMGNLDGRISVRVTSTEPRPGWGAYLSHETLFMAGGEEVSVALTFMAPLNAPAGSRQVIEVGAVTDELSARSSVQVSAVVKQVHGLTSFIKPIDDTVHAGEEAMYLMSVTNEGNGNEEVALGSALVPQGWDVSFEIDGVVALGIELAPKASETVLVVVSIPWDARGGSGQVLDIVLTDSTDTSYILPLHVNVLTWYAVDLSAPSSQGEVASDGTITYQLVLHNAGNGEDTFLLEHGPLPGTGWEAGFHATDGTPVASVTLEGGERRGIELRVHVPDDADVAGPLDLIARATSSSAVADEVKLILDLRAADLKILSVGYKNPRGRGFTQVTVQVRNDGSVAADNVTVVMTEDGEELGRKLVGTMEAGSTATVTFRWNPEAGKHTLTYRVSADGREADLRDNVLEHVRTVEGESPALAALGVVLALLVLAGITLAVWTRRRRKPM